MPMTDCTTTIGELSAYTDGELTVEEELLFRRHLKECPACQQMMGILATLKESVTGSVELYPLPRALRVVLQLHPQPQRWSLFSWGLFLRRGLVVALLFLAFAVGAGLVRKNGVTFPKGKRSRIIFCLLCQDDNTSSHILRKDNKQ